MQTKTKDINDDLILLFLANRQGQWTSLWDGYFKESDPSVQDIYYAFPEGTPPKVALSKMRSLHKRGYVGGCTCGCRGDWEITDLGLAKINFPRLKPYTGYGEKHEKEIG
jgi:hypothetical protein